jgi:plasmid maintenance system antidote protein VapI
MDIAKQLVNAIEKDGRTIYAIAKAAGISPIVVHRFVNGERDIRMQTAARLAETLHLELRAKQRRGR